jgi:predicted mannosyl-3-phosphoglycerate phosphatase (HAD superfamily)
MLKVMPPLLFCDLDGTFLDAAHAPALSPAAFAALAARWRVVFVSSRTAAELAHLLDALGHPGDAIGENGGVAHLRDPALAAALRARPSGGVWVAEFAAPVAETRARVRAAFDRAGASAVVVNDRGPGWMAARSGYDHDAAARALARRTSVLLTEMAPPAPARRALAALAADGCAVAWGGRWTSVAHGADKGTTARAYLAALTATHGAPTAVAAVGNADNDAPLLRVTTHAFAFPGADGAVAPALRDLAAGLPAPPPDGWSALLDHLDRITA